MSYCSKCGSYIPDSALKCPACGKLKIGAAETAQQAERQSKPQSGFDRTSAPPQSYRYGYSQSEQQTSGESRPQRDQYERYRTDDYSGTAPGGDIEENKALGAISYLGPLVVLSMILKPNSPFVRFHANQSIALMIFSVLCSLCRFVPFFGWMIGIFGGIFTLVNVFRGFFSAMNGQMKIRPRLGSLDRTMERSSPLERWATKLRI